MKEKDKKIITDADFFLGKARSNQSQATRALNAGKMRETLWYITQAASALDSLQDVLDAGGVLNEVKYRLEIAVRISRLEKQLRLTE